MKIYIETNLLPPLTGLHESLHNNLWKANLEIESTFDVVRLVCNAHNTFFATDVVFGAGANHIWISDRKTKTRYFFITK